MFWDEEIYCFPRGRSTTGFWSQPIELNGGFRSYYRGEVLGDFPTQQQAEQAVEEAFQGDNHDHDEV